MESKHGTFTYLDFCLCEHVPNCVVLNPTHSVHIYFLFVMHSVISFFMTFCVQQFVLNYLTSWFSILAFISAF